jgi:hypothetical protein
LEKPILVLSNMAKRPTPTTFAEYFQYGPETQQQFADRLTRKYGIRICQASVSEAVKHGRGSFSRLKMFAKEAGIPLDSFDRRVAA